jgi:hypothetical protein
MKKIKRLKLNELQERTSPFEEDILRSVIGGSYGSGNSHLCSWSDVNSMMYAGTWYCGWVNDTVNIFCLGAEANYGATVYGTHSGGYNTSASDFESWITSFFDAASSLPADLSAFITDNATGSSYAGNEVSIISIINDSFQHTGGQISDERYAYRLATTLAASYTGTLGPMAGAAAYAYERAYDFIIDLVNFVNSKYSNLNWWYYQMYQQ